MRYGYASPAAGAGREGGVTARTMDAKVRLEYIRAKYLVGCDGRRESCTPQAVGIKLRGEGEPSASAPGAHYSETLATAFRSGYGTIVMSPDGRRRSSSAQDLTPNIGYLRGRRTDETWPSSSCAVGALIDYTTSASAMEAEPASADHYGTGRSSAGDAAHLVIPDRGLGRNTGVGDAIDLAAGNLGDAAGLGWVGSSPARDRATTGGRSNRRRVALCFAWPTLRRLRTGWTSATRRREHRGNTR
ncbi:FAD-dependent monooxygenase [Sinorhizobium psoraleae]|uniref:FAD-dependent monooxygenase n=1 Tax=Sinorhizobium psoraleae TaxID=520838 RepID=UPI0035E3EDAE